VTAITDLVPDVLEYLVTQAKASPVLTGLGCAVFDGPQPTAAVNGKEYVLWIGHNPRVTDAQAGEAEQGFAFLASSTRDEAGQVTCTARHWSGDFQDFGSHRAACKQIVGAVELLLRGGGASPGPGDATMDGLVQWSEFTSAAWWQDLAGGGAEVFCAFEISYFARLTS
jgi:hypothetical protein